MEGFVRRDVVVLPFPFSDMTGSKLRPAFVLSDLSGDDIILCQITSQHTKDKFAIPLNLTDFDSGSLPSSSNIRPSRLFTADKNIIIRKAGKVITIITKSVVRKVIEIISE